MRYYFTLALLISLLSCKVKQQIAKDNTVVNVEQFGAIGDDAKDDTEAIQAAISYFKDKPSGKILFNAQKYIISATIKIESDNLEINLNNAIVDGTFLAKEDENQRSVFLFTGFKQSETSGIFPIQPSDKVIKNETLTRLNYLDNIQVINKELLQKERTYYYKTEFLAIKSIERVKNQLLLEQKPILAYDSNQEIRFIAYDFIENTIIKNGTILCKQLGLSSGVVFEKSKNCKVENLIVKNTTFTGIQFNNSINCTVDNCTIERAAYKDNGLDYGVLFSYSQYGRCSNSTFKGGRTGGDLSLSHFIEFVDNELFGCGINPHAGTNNLIKKNKLHNGEIYMRCSDSVIDSNEIWIDHQRHGAITLSELYAGKNIKITNNKIYFAKNTVFEKGQRRDSGTGVYSDEHCLKNIIIENNEIYNAARGIYFFKASNEPCNEGLDILNNRIIECAEFGVCTDRYAQQKIVGNTIKGRTESCIGIAMWASGGKFDEISIKENYIENVGQGISVSEYYERVSVKANKMLKVKKKYNGSIEKELKN